MCSYANETYCSLYTVLNIVFKVELNNEMQILITIYDNFFFIYEHYLHIDKIKKDDNNLNCLYLIDKISKYISRIFLVLFNPINFNLDKNGKIVNSNLIYEKVQFENISELTLSDNQIVKIIEIIRKYSTLIKFILIWEKFYRGKTVVNTFLEQNLSFFDEKIIILSDIKQFIDEISNKLNIESNLEIEELSSTEQINFESKLEIEELSSTEQINFEHQNSWSENYLHS